jgi:hypothetical protein
MNNIWMMMRKSQATNENTGKLLKIKPSMEISIKHMKKKKKNKKLVLLKLILIRPVLSASQPIVILKPAPPLKIIPLSWRSTFLKGRITR